MCTRGAFAAIATATAPEPVPTSATRANPPRLAMASSATSISSSVSGRGISAAGEDGFAHFLRLGEAARGRVVEDRLSIEADREYSAGRGDQHDLVSEVRTRIDNLARDPERAALEPARHAEFDLEAVPPLLCH